MVNYLWVMAASLGHTAAALYAIESVLSILHFNWKAVWTFWFSGHLIKIMITEQWFWLANGNLKVYKTFHNSACLFWNINRRPELRFLFLSWLEGKKIVSKQEFLSLIFDGNCKHDNSECFDNQSHTVFVSNSARSEPLSSC